MIHFQKSFRQLTGPDPTIKVVLDLEKDLLPLLCRCSLHNKSGSKKRGLGNMIDLANCHCSGFSTFYDCLLDTRARVIKQEVRPLFDGCC